MKPVSNRTNKISPTDIIVFSTLRNERARLPFFLEYYRRLGVNHFIMVDNDSTDGSRQYLAEQNDISLWQTKHSYKKSRFGVDWLNYLLNKYGKNHWVLTVDVDEFLVYPHIDTRPLRALTDWLDDSSLKSFPAMLIDMYSDKPVKETIYHEGDNPMEVTPYFDSGNYFQSRNALFGNLWIQGGVRMRKMFFDKPQFAPALNKIPLVKWKLGRVYVSSTHSLLPRGLNLVYDDWGGEKVSGCLMHCKFLSSFEEKVSEEINRRQHYAASREYFAYSQEDEVSESFWTPKSEHYTDWRQLEEFGLISRGGWS